jgi:hypothetical protein
MQWRSRRRRKGTMNARAQHTVEYVLLIGVVIVALSAVVNIVSRLCSARLGHVANYAADKENP